MGKAENFLIAGMSLEIFIGCQTARTGKSYHPTEEVLERIFLMS